MDKKDHDWSMVPKNQGITVGDFVKVRGMSYEVLGMAQDWANPNFDCVRFKTDFTKNANNSTYSIVPMPMLQGNAGSPQRKISLLENKSISNKTDHKFCRS